MCTHARAWLCVSLCVCVCLFVPRGIRFMKAYAWITSEGWPQVANLMSSLNLLLCQLCPHHHHHNPWPPSPNLKKPQSAAYSFVMLLQHHYGQKWDICALLKGGEKCWAKSGCACIKNKKVIIWSLYVGYCFSSSEEDMWNLISTTVNVEMNYWLTDFGNFLSKRWKKVNCISKLAARKLVR